MAELKDDPPAAPESSVDFVEETRMVSARDLADMAPGPAGRIKVDPLPEGPKPYLEATLGLPRGTRFPIDKPLVIIGRVVNVADIVIADDSVSRHHAAVGHQSGKFVLYDLGSTNGTFVDGEPITRIELGHGMEVRIGDTTFTFWLD